MATEPEVTVMVVDDQAPFRSAARAVIGRTRGFRWVAEARGGEEAVEVAGGVHPDLVLMDMNLDEVSGTAATTRIVESGDAVVFLCSTYAASDLPPDAATCGASAYLHKEALASSVLRDLWDARDEGWRVVDGDDGRSVGS